MFAAVVASVSMAATAAIAVVGAQDRHSLESETRDRVDAAKIQAIQAASEQTDNRIRSAVSPKVDQISGEMSKISEATANNDLALESLKQKLSEMERKNADRVADEVDVKALSLAIAEFGGKLAALNSQIESGLARVDMLIESGSADTIDLRRDVTSRMDGLRADSDRLADDVRDIQARITQAIDSTANQRDLQESIAEIDGAQKSMRETMIRLTTQLSAKSLCLGDTCMEESDMRRVLSAKQPTTPYTLVDGNPVKCKGEDHKVYRYANRELRHYPSSDIARSWDPDWDKGDRLRVIDCTGIPEGPAMVKADQTPGATEPMESLGWKRLNGTLSQVTTDGTHVLGISPSGQFWLSRVAQGTWRKVGGFEQATHISIDSPRVVGVDAGDVVWSTDGVVDFFRLPDGLMTRVSLSGTMALGCQRNNQLYIRDVVTLAGRLQRGSVWSRVRLADELRGVVDADIDRSNACVVDLNGDVYKSRNVDLELGSKATWSALGGIRDVKRVCLSENLVCALTGSGALFCTTFSSLGGEWRRVPGRVSSVSLGRGGTLYALDEMGNIFHQTLDVQPWPLPRAIGEPFTDATIKFGPGRRVLGCQDPDCKVGSNIQIWDPTGTPNQAWTYDADSKSLRANGRCLDVAEGGKRNGTNVRVWGCDGSGAQNWVPQANEGPGKGSVQFKNTNSGKCLDVSGGRDAEGQNVQIWDCKASYQSWDIE